MTPILRIIRPSSREANDLLGGRLDELAAAGFTVRYDDLPPDPGWTYAAASAKDRAAALMAALLEPDSDAVVCARGGYGASDLLPLLDWAALARAKPKLVVGFSDVSALHGALYGRLGWPGLHAPMPATVLWRKDGVATDVDALLATLRRLHDGRAAEGRVSAASAGPSWGGDLSGPLFGGCFTVLTALIGTPYFPKSLAGHIVFVEDTDESPARLMRALNTWLQSGALAGVRALVVGNLRGLGDKVPDCAPFVIAEFAKRAGVPVAHAPEVGHVCPNHPLMIGADATLTATSLSWRMTS